VKIAAIDGSIDAPTNWKEVRRNTKQTRRNDRGTDKNRKKINKFYHYRI
jgi:hypothetical protein